MSSLVIPEWCNTDIVMKDDDDGWSLEEIKNGIVVQKYPIQKSCIFFGREADVVDVCTAHGSCSRVHARIAFDSKYAWLRDLGSAHGTKVNKESLPSISIGKDIPNNNNNNNGTIMKGVIVYPGDIIQFGASTRFYCLQGPSQYSRESIQSQKQQLQQQQQQQQQQQRKEEGISWGMDMNDDDEENDEDETNNDKNGNLDWYKIFEKNRLPSNCKSLYQQWTNKQNKLKHIQEESQRIQRKHELTEGQTLQLERNLQKQSSIQIEIEQIENELEEKFYNTNNPTKKRKQQTYHHDDDDDDDDDVDDFYDRTKHAKSQHTNNNNTIVETQESLLKQWKQHLNDQTEMNVEYQRRQQTILNIQQQIANSTSDDDVFFIKNDLQIANDNLTQIKMKLTSIEEELQSVEKLLKVILPNDHTLDRIHQQIITPEMTTKTKSTNNDTMLPPAPRPSIRPPSASSNNDVNNQSNSLMPPPPSPSCNNEKKQDTNSFMLPPPSISRNDEDKPVTNSLMLPPPSRSSSTTKVSKPPSSDQMAPPPPRKPVTKPRKLIGPSNHAPPMYQNQEKQNKSSFDNTKDEWTAPKDQDGSGITKLNAKFAGRY